MQGWRNTMEDSHIASCNLENNVSVFGVFDGHGGMKSLNDLLLIIIHIRVRSCIVC